MKIKVVAEDKVYNREFSAHLLLRCSLWDIIKNSFPAIKTSEIALILINDDIVIVNTNQS